MARHRTTALVVFLTALVVLAGCSGLGGTATDTEADAVGDDDESADDGTATPTETATEARQQVTNRVQVVAATGTHVRNESVGVVNLTVKRAPGGANIDLRDVTVQWVSADGTYTLVDPSVAGDAADGAFGVSTIEDADGSAPVLNDPDDRQVLTFDLGSDDTGAAPDAFGARLPAGETATLRLTTRSGATTTVRLVVPRSLSGQNAVAL